MKKLLVVRNDKLGDLILTLPALKIIKSSITEIEIDCLVDSKYYEIKYMTKYIKTRLHNREQCMELIYIINGIDYIDNSDINSVQKSLRNQLIKKLMTNYLTSMKELMIK